MSTLAMNSERGQQERFKYHPGRTRKITEEDLMAVIERMEQDKTALEREVKERRQHEEELKKEKYTLQKEVKERRRSEEVAYRCANQSRDHAKLSAETNTMLCESLKSRRMSDCKNLSLHEMPAALWKGHQQFMECNTTSDGDEEDEVFSEMAEDKLEWDISETKMLPGDLCTPESYTKRCDEFYAAIKTEHGPSLVVSSFTDLENWTSCCLPEDTIKVEALFNYDEQVHAFVRTKAYPDKVQLWRMNQYRCGNTRNCSWRHQCNFPISATHFALLVNMDSLVVAPGLDEDFQPLQSVYVRDLSLGEEGQWNRWPDLPKNLQFGRLVCHGSRVAYIGGWSHKKEQAIRLSMKAYSINPTCPLPWDEDSLSPLPLSQAGIISLGYVLSVGGCPLSGEVEYSSDRVDEALSFSKPRADSAICMLGSDSDDDSSSGEEPSNPVVQSTHHVRPDPKEDMPQCDVSFWDDTVRKWQSFPALKEPCSEPCLLYANGTLLCFGGKNEKGQKTRQFQTIRFHY